MQRPTDTNQAPADRVHRWNERRWGTLTEDNIRARFEFEGYSSVIRYEYPPDTSLENQTEDSIKTVVVLDGELSVTLDNESFLLQAGDLLRIPAGASYSFNVVGAADVVILEADKTQ